MRLPRCLVGFRFRNAEPVVAIFTSRFHAGVFICGFEDFLATGTFEADH